MVALLDEIVVLGGFDEAGRVVDRVEALDPVAGEWRSLPALPVAMHHAQAAVIGDRIYILGFLTTANFTADGRAFVFDAGAWRPIASLPAGKARGAAKRGGGALNVTLDDLAAWSAHAGAGFALHQFTGGHFFLHAHAARLVALAAAT